MNVTEDLTYFQTLEHGDGNNLYLKNLFILLQNSDSDGSVLHTNTIQITCNFMYPPVNNKLDHGLSCEQSRKIYTKQSSTPIK